MEVNEVNIIRDMESFEALSDQNQPISNLEKAAIDFNKKELEILGETIRPIADDILNFDVKSKMSLEIFKQNFMEPISKGTAISNPTIFNKWTELAGNPYNGVELIDNDGKVAYTTPGLFSRANIDKSIAEMNFIGIATLYNLTVTNGISAVADNELARNLSPVADKISAKTKDDIDKWVEIIKDINSKSSKTVGQISNDKIEEAMKKDVVKTSGLEYEID